VVAVDLYGVRPDAQGALHGVEVPGLESLPGLAGQRPDAQGMPSRDARAAQAPYSRIERLATDVATFADAVRNGSELPGLTDAAREMHVSHLDYLRQQAADTAEAVKLAVARGEFEYRPAVVAALTRFERGLREYERAVEMMPAELAERLNSWDFFWHLDIQANLIPGISSGIWISRPT
jgi:hypothetical protein